VQKKIHLKYENRINIVVVRIKHGDQQKQVAREQKF